MCRHQPCGDRHRGVVDDAEQRREQEQQRRVGADQGRQEEDRGAAYGWVALTVGLLAFPASLGFGVLWDEFGPAVPFLTGSALALSAVVALLAMNRETVGRA